MIIFHSVKNIRTANTMKLYFQFSCNLLTFYKCCCSCLCATLLLFLCSQSKLPPPLILVSHLSYISFKIFPFCNYILLPALVNSLETFLEATLWNTFQFSLQILSDICSFTKGPFLQYWLHWREQIKIGCGQVRIALRMLQCCHIVLYQEMFYQNRPVCWSIVVMNKTTICSPFFGAIPTDRMHNATKEIHVQKYPSRIKSC
jgi:hypothetical protein